MARDLEGRSDEELFLLCRETPDPAQIRAAVGMLARRHHVALVRYLTGFVGRPETAEDLAQEAFIRIYRHAREYREVAKVSTWLYRIATNLALNEIRDRKRRPALSLHAPIGDDGEERIDGVADAREDPPPRRAELADLTSRVRAVIAELPELYRMVLLLCDLEGLTYEAAAEALGVKIGTVRSRLFRARERFQERMGPIVVRGEL